MNMSQSKSKSRKGRSSASSRTFVMGIDFGTLSGRALLAGGNAQIISGVARGKIIGRQQRAEAINWQ